jgi:hypothetical protein
MKRLVFALMLLILLTSLWVAMPSTGAITAQEPLGTPTRTPTITRTPTSTPVAIEDYAAFLRVGLSAIPAVQNVEVTLDRRRRIATITYASAALDTQARNDEWVNIFQVVADTIVNQRLTIDQIVLIAVQGEPVGRVTLDGPSLRSFGIKRLSRAALLRRAQFRSLIPTLTPTLRPTRTPRPTAIPAEIPQPTAQQQNAAACPSSGITCSQLTCAQAYACLAAGYTKLDADHDGKPCESQCGG